jgi:hypothetical protein
MRCADGSDYSPSSTVDIFDAGSGQWTTAALSLARGYLAATSLPNQGLAVFAGGYGLWFAFFLLFAIDVVACCLLWGCVWAAG